uniref:Uncharacterized protein n=1 Tax=Hyaloperonospora arabidopsidis (strain Emoy2) TaxID=559515 RepID=M4B5U9_HYAAE
MVAAAEGHADVVRALLRRGADVSMRTYELRSREDLEQEQERDERRAEVLTMLLEKNGKLVNFQDREGSSAMHLAASCGYLACVKTLLVFGADITLRNAVGQTPLEEAQESELLGSSACVEHLRGIWRQLEEEAAIRMMAMLEMEEDAASSAASTVSYKKSKKKNKKAKRKTAIKLQQQVQQEAEQDRIYSDNVTAQEGENHDGTDEAATSERLINDLSVTAVDVSATEVKDDETSSVSSEEAPIGYPVVVVGPECDDDREGHAVNDGVSPPTGTMHEQSTQATKRDPLLSTSAWTTVGKKHRSAIAVVASTPAKALISPLREKTLLSTSTRRRNSAATLCPNPFPHTSRRKPTQRSGDTRERSLFGGSSVPAAAELSIKQGDVVDHPSSRTQAEQWGKWSGSATSSRSFTSSSPLNADAPSFRSLGPTTGSTQTPSVLSSIATSNSSGLSISSASLQRPSFGFPHAPHSTASTTGMYYSPAGRLAWKQHRSSSIHQVAQETRDRWVSKLQPSNESVAETLGYLACGLCGELVNDNLQCSGSPSKKADEKTSTCTQLYCASCLECSTFRVASSVTFKCIKCHELITKESMTRNSLAQAQAASLGLSMSAGMNTGAQGEAAGYTLETMQHTLEMSGPRISAVNLRAFFLVPGTDLSTLSNGQLEVLENVHQLALNQIVEQRLANARALERLQMEEWLKIRRDLLQFAPR